MRVAAIIPVLDEREGLRRTLSDLPAEIDAGAFVVDGGSTDGTAELARDAGAHVVVERRPGYGRAVHAGVAAALDAGAAAAVVFDGNGSVRPADVIRVLAPLVDGRADLALGIRPGDALRPLQRLGNRLATSVIALRHGVRFGDLGWIRALTRGALERLALDEPGYGWPMQLHLRAAARGLRVVEVPVRPRERLGRSKVSGTLRGTVGAGLAFARVAAREWRSR